MITGSIVALVTPMLEDGAVDWSALDRLVEWHIAEGTDAIVAVGTTGESPTLSVQEHMAVIKRIIDVSAKRIPVIAGTGANSTAEAIDWTKEAHSYGADACLLVAPYYNKPTQEGMYQHYKAIAEAVAVPQILYNVPGRTVVDLLPETVIRLAPIGNIIGIKEATGDIRRAKEIIAATDDDFLVYSGDDETCVELMLAGGNGNISVTANLVPQLMSKLCKQAIAGQSEAARALNAELAILHESLFVEPSPIPVKWALQAMGYIQGGIRLPLLPLSDVAIPQVKAALIQTGLLQE